MEARLERGEESMKNRPKNMTRHILRHDGLVRNAAEGETKRKRKKTYEHKAN